MDFEDLIPKTKTAGVDFSDLVPKKQAGMFDDLLPPPTALDYVKEYETAPLRGAADTAGSVLKGYGAQIPELVRQRIQATQAAEEPLAPGASLEEQLAYRRRRSVVHRGPEVTAERVAADLPMANTPAAETSLYKAGEFVSGLAPKSKGILNPLVEDVATASGSVMANMATGMIPGAGVPLAVVSALGQGAGEAAESAVKAKATEPQIAKAAGLGTIAGATEFVDSLLPKLGSPGKVAGLIRKVGLPVLEGIAIEGGQEGLQQYIQNLIAQGVYKPEQDPWEKVGYSALIGAIVGGVAGGTISSIKGTSTEATDENLQDALGSLTGGQTEPQVPAVPVTANDAAPVGGPGDQLAALKTSTPVAPAVAPQSVEQAPPVEQQQLELPIPEPPPVEGQMTTLDLAGYPHPAKWVMFEGTLQKAYVNLQTMTPGTSESNTIDSYRTITEPLSHDPYIRERPPAQVAETFAEAEQIAMDFARHADQIQQVAKDYEPSVRRSIADAPDLERAQTMGPVPVEQDFQPATTVQELPPGVVLWSQNETARRPQGEIDPVTGKYRAYSTLEYARGLPNEKQLLETRKRQILYDRNLDLKTYADRKTGVENYPIPVEVRQINQRLKELSLIPNALPSQGNQVVDLTQVLAPPPPTQTFRIYDDGGKRVIDLNSEHMAYVNNWLDHIVPARNPNGAWSDLTSIIFRTVKNRLKQIVPPGLQIHIVSDVDMSVYSKTTTTDAFYLQSEGDNRVAPVIVIRRGLLNDPQNLSHTIMHEVVHAATSHALDRQDAVGINLTNDVRLIMIEAQTQLNQVGIPAQNMYAWANEHEFIAELLSNPQLQMGLSRLQAPQELRKLLKLDGPRKMSLWSAVVQFMHRMLGLPYNSETYTILEAALRTSERIIDAQNRLPHPVDLLSPAYIIGSKANQKALDVESKNLVAVEAQPETEGARNAVKALFAKGPIPIKIRQAAAFADHITWLYKKMAGLSQLANVNPNHAPLISYRETTQAMHLDEVRIHDAAVRIGKDWFSLGDRRGTALSNFIDDLGHMSYRSPIEVQNHVVRHPSSQEFTAMARKHKLDQESLLVFKRINQSINGDPATGARGFIGLIEQSIIEHLQRTIADPVALANRIKAVQTQVQNLRARPYFPFTNFGQHYVTVRDPNGKMVHVETMERSGFASAEKVQKRRMGELQRDFQQHYGVAPVMWKPGMSTTQGNIFFGKLPDHVGPLIGMPGILLEHIARVQQLTPEQINAAADLQLAELADAQPMLSSRFQRKYYVPGYGFGAAGYSRDLRRSFAKYFFHGAKFYSKSKHMDGLKAQLEAARLIPGNKEADIAQYMQEHFDDTVKDARGDWGWAKGMIFLYALGYVPAAAMQNLSQVPIVSHAYLWAKFGEGRALLSLGKAMFDLKSYYRDGEYQKSSNPFELKALGYGIRTGRISESQASEIAAMSQHSLLNGIGGSKAERLWTRFMQGSSYMFEAAEQWNRRITFRAALELAMKNPKAKVIDEAVNLHTNEYQQLRNEGFSDPQARAILTAVHTVDQTQYVYARWDRPKFMRKPLPSLIFVFKKYVQSTQFMLGQNPDVFWRYALISMFVGGLAGLPFTEDILSLIKGVGALFGRDWDIERATRKHVIELFDGTIDPDIVLRGFARRGMGIPWLLDAMGSFATGTPGRGLISRGAPVIGKDPETGEDVQQNFAQNVPFPVLDRSRAYSMGQILPVDLGKMLTPVKDIKDTIAEQTEKASGAFFSVGFNMYKSMLGSDLEMSDWKRWERAIPRVAGDASEMFRAFSEGRERTKGGPAGGSTVISYDVRDTEQMMEAIATGLGYNILRKQAHYDLVMKKLEIDKFYDIQKEGLLKNLYEAVSGQNEQEIDQVRSAISTYNDRLPEWAKGKAISGDSALKSVEGRFRARALREMGLGSTRGSVPIAQEVDRLYPESVIDVRRR